MAVSELTVLAVLVSQTTIGVLGNLYLLYHYLFLYLMRYRVRSTDWVLMHLIVGNILTLLTKGVPQSMSAFGLRDFLTDIECKLLGSFHRVGRGVCIGSTSFLSVFQAIIINPRGSRHSELRVKSHKCICYSVYLNWVIHFLISTMNLMYQRARRGNESIADLKSFGYCSSVRHDQTRDILFALLLSAPDVLFLGLMLWASGSMFLTLYKHKKRMQHMSRPGASSGSSAESRATKTILLLVSTFVSLYAASSLTQLFGALMYNPSCSLLNLTAMSSLFFPTVCPFLLMSRDSQTSTSCLPLKRSRHFPKTSDQN